MKKQFLSLLLILLLLLSLASCGSAYEHPERYLTLPPLSEITVSEEEIDKQLKEVVKDLLENMEGEHYTPLSGAQETVRKGDRVHVSFAPNDSSLSAETVKLLTTEEKDRMYVIPGSDSMPKAFENAVLGTKAGDVLSVQVSYTDEDTDIEELIGKTVSFNLTVHRIARLTVKEHHSVKLQFTAELADGSVPIDQILSLLKGGIETVALNDHEDTFDEVFSAIALREHLVGLHKYDEATFTLTMIKETAEANGYDRDIDIRFHVTVNAISEIPTELTDLLVDEMTYGVYTDADAYLTFCRDLVKEELALNAVMAAAVFDEKLPEKEYDEFYTENYNAALYSVVGDVSGYTPEELQNMLSQEALDKVEATAHENTVKELRERLMLEYLYDLLDITISDEEYTEKLNELFDSYYEEYYYMLYYYNITTPEALESYLGKDYLIVQFLYEKLLPILKNHITYTK